MLLSDFTNQNICIDRVIKMLLLHDIAELIDGDLYAFHINNEFNQKERMHAISLFYKLPKHMNHECLF